MDEIAFIQEIGDNPEVYDASWEVLEHSGSQEGCQKVAHSGALWPLSLGISTRIIQGLENPNEEEEALKALVVEEVHQFTQKLKITDTTLIRKILSFALHYARWKVEIKNTEK